MGPGDSVSLSQTVEQWKNPLVNGVETIDETGGMVKGGEEGRGPEGAGDGDLIFESLRISLGE